MTVNKDQWERLVDASNELVRRYKEGGRWWIVADDKELDNFLNSCYTNKEGR